MSDTSYADAISFLIRLLVAVILGTLISVQNPTKNAFAGLRPHLIIAAGSCLVSASGLDLYFEGLNGDSTRLAGQILSGVGFVAAGVIMRRGVGATTAAATLFCAAGIGITCGLGFLNYALVTTVLILICNKVTAKIFPLEEIGGRSLRLSFRPKPLSEIRTLIGHDCRFDAVIKHEHRIDIHMHLRDLSWASMHGMILSLKDNPDVLGIRHIEDSM